MEERPPQSGRSMKKRTLVSFGITTVVILLALTVTQTLWRDVDYKIEIGSIISFEDSWGASAGTMGENCLAPSFGRARVVAVDGAWVTLEDAGAYYWSWTNTPGCDRFQRTRHWVRKNIMNKAAIEARAAKHDSHLQETNLADYLADQERQ
ncbi:MAG: hypothetical protein AB200_01035 [Parcubacteria bacterium C7867-005]|nr:MAG: hypothetical protein AB200_01035 [Parcubacteria bacterium C7867-005]